MIINFGYIYIELQTNIADKLDFPCKIKSSNNNLKPGGHAVNQAISAARSGAKLSIVGAIGNDLFGENILHLLRHEGIKSSGIIKTEQHTGVINSIINDSNQTAQILLDGANTDLTPELISNTTLNERTLIILQGETPHDINLEILKRTKDRNAKSIMCFKNADNHDLADYADISIIYNDGEININNHTFILEKPENFDSFCGTFAACKQAGLNTDRAIEYGIAAASIDSSDGLPYLDDIKAKLKTPTT